MHVSEILKTKGSDVVSTRAEETIVATARLLRQRKIGAVLVTDAGGGVVGIISERDIVRAIAEHGDKALAMTVDDLMSKNVLSCTSNETLTHVMEVMTTQRIRHLPIIEDSQLKGIVTIGDVVKYRLEEAEMEVEAMRGYVTGAA